ncbi:hypothetical protein [Helicobacter brantae]|uniref:CAAX protease n=1 Tax=Helicobacter brantae TaxID=375927 RepID=A0A3D8J0R4_9HELI|nr:hypothetical protein [Helicobacter brantae]RDU70800.1 hypothetical protein CQA58_04565 [Helicobacter brantae]
MPTLQNLNNAVDRLYLTDKTTFIHNFSIQRYQSIGGQEKYQKYFEITKSLYPAIATIEIILRNKINNTLTKHSAYWIMDFYFYEGEVKGNFGKEITLKMKDSILKVLLTLGAKSNDIEGFWEKCKEKEAIHYSILSKLTFGFWIMVLHNEKIFNNLYQADINFAKNVFPKLEERPTKDPSLFFSFLHHESKATLKIIKDRLFPSHRTLILASFLTSIRNRLSHCEFLFKEKKNITTKSSKVKAYLKDTQSNVIRYLVCILESFED